MTVKAKVAGPIAKLRRLSANLERLKVGQPAEETARIVGEEAGEEIVASLGPHRRSGNAESTMLIQTSAKGVKLVAAYYLKFHEEWWEFADGFPARYAARAKEVFAEQVHNLLRW